MYVYTDVGQGSVNATKANALTSVSPLERKGIQTVVFDLTPLHTHA